MILLYYYRMKNQLGKESFDMLLQLLPSAIQNKILKFRNWQDAERCLVGNILLIQGIQALGRMEFSLNDLKYTGYRKPYFDDSISFNISHSGEYIICAISESNKVGVDIEEIKSIPFEDFSNLFADQEWDAVANSENKFHAFYTLWTKKEAFLKVIGCGLSQPLNEVVIQNNCITWEGKEWFLHAIDIDSQHIAYLCSDIISPEVHLREIYL